MRMQKSDRPEGRSLLLRNALADGPAILLQTA